MSVLTRITTRAKQIYKKGKAGITWVAAIKRASTQIKSKASPKRKRTRTVKRRRRVGGEVPAYRTFNSIVWQKVKDDKIPFVERGNSYYTNDKYNQLITWSFRDSRQAQSWLKRNKSGKIGAIVHNPKLLAAGLGKGPRASHTSYVKVPTVSGVGQGRKTIGSDPMEGADFWLKMFAPRTKKQQRAFYTMIKKELKTGKISIFSTAAQRRAQMKALNYLLGYSQTL